MSKTRQPDRLWIEDPDKDFPFYNGKPIKISASKWAIIIAFLIFGFILLTKMNLPFIPFKVNEFLQTISLPLFAVLGLYLTIGSYIKKFFRPLHKKDILTIIVFAILSLIVSSALSAIVGALSGGVKANPAAAVHGGADALPQFLWSRFLTIIQLFGEEFMALIPFLACLTFFYHQNPHKRKRAVWLALICSSLIFGLLHLPTYQWDFVQCIFVIGLGRVIDSLAYVKTKNLLVTYIAHVIYDLAIYIFAFLA